MAKDILMPQELAGLQFSNPFIVASGPASKNVDQIVAAEKAGWGGVSIKLTIDPYPYINPPPPLSLVARSRLSYLYGRDEVGLRRRAQSR